MPISSYETKFQSFIQMCSAAKVRGVDTVVVHHPEVLADNYAEIVESLNRLAAADLSLKIVPPEQRNDTGSGSDYGRGAIDGSAHDTSFLMSQEQPFNGCFHA